MATELRLRRGTTDEHGNFIGAEAEATVDTDKNTIVVHDGQTQGGFPLIKEESLGTAADEVPTNADLRANTLSDLQSLDTTNARSVYMLGRSSIGDGGEGHFRWDSSDLSTEVGNDELTAGEGDGGIYVAPDSNKSGTAGAWVREHGIYALPEMYGAKGDGINDDTTAFKKSAESGRVLSGRRGATYKITGVEINEQCVIALPDDTTVLMENGAEPPFRALISLVADNSSVTGGRWIGNKGTVATKVSGIAIRGDGCKLRGIYLKDHQRHGIYLDNVENATVENILGYTIYRDHVSVTGSSKVSVTNVRGYGSDIRGVVEVNDGCSEVAVDQIHGEDVDYVVAFQDHGSASHKNIGVSIRNITGRNVYLHMVDCQTDETVDHQDLSISNVFASPGDVNGSVLKVKGVNNVDISNVFNQGDGTGPPTMATYYCSNMVIHGCHTLDIDGDYQIFCRDPSNTLITENIFDAETEKSVWISGDVGTHENIVVTGNLERRSIKYFVEINESSATFNKVSIYNNVEQSSNEIIVSELVHGEGRWTPAYEPDTNSFDTISYRNQNTWGKWVRYGKMVTLWGEIATEDLSLGTASGDLRISGIPFSPKFSNYANSESHAGVVSKMRLWAFSTTPSKVEMEALGGESFLRMPLQTTIGGNSGFVQVTDMATGSNNRNFMTFCISFITDGP